MPQDHVAEISLGASILCEYHPNWTTFAQLYYYNSDTQEGRTVTWEVNEAAALISNMRQCAEGQLQGSEARVIFLNEMLLRGKKFERKRGGRRREARAQQQPEQPRKRKKKVKMSHFDEEKQNCEDGMQIKELSYTPRAALIVNSIRAYQRHSRGVQRQQGSWKRE